MVDHCLECWIKEEKFGMEIKRDRGMWDRDGREMFKQKIESGYTERGIKRGVEQGS